ncbi:hypothetical protein BDZ85DRAFT_245793 [Elsinoe ampelina]|uniref:MaoC-like domain-containing protein n=1 Tax=Elsinoe ampelina TaxID=302913 RepID=A0A6A6GNA1_9PEZI|nr:hypothetical protein BDZ85DRAFT_245793 [Elsinoe ampelina]
MPLRIRSSQFQDYATAINTIKSEMSARQISKHIASNQAHLAMFLGSLIQPAIPLLLARKRSPIRPLGAVNVSNRAEMIDVAACRRLVLDTDVESGGAAWSYTISASLPKHAQIVKRGIQTNLVVSIIEETTEHGKREIYRLTFTMLEFRKQARRAHANGKESVNQLDHSINASIDVGSFKMTHADPSNWARICKDYNFIHFSTLVARLFGMKGRIAHGNHVVAKAIEVIGTQTGSEIPQEGRRLEMRFKRPVLIPSRLIIRRSSTSASTMAKQYLIAPEGHEKPSIEVDVHL